MKHLMIIAGPYGAGKTSLVQTKPSQVTPLTLSPKTYINPEEYFESLRGHYALPEHYVRSRRSERNPNFIARANERAQTNRFRFLVKGRDFVTELTLDSVEDMDILAAARNYDYHISLYFIGVSSWQICKQRLKKNHNHWHHNLSEAEIAACYHRSLSFLPGAVPYIDHGLVLDNSSPLSPRKVLSINDGRIELTSEKPPAWLIEPMSRCL